MLIDLTPNELMWINDMCTRECIRGKALIDRFKDDEKPEAKAAVLEMCKIASAIAELGLKTCSALDKWRNENEKKNEEDGEGDQDGQ